MTSDAEEFAAVRAKAILDRVLAMTSHFIRRG